MTLLGGCSPSSGVSSTVVPAVPPAPGEVPITPRPAETATTGRVDRYAHPQAGYTYQVYVPTAHRVVKPAPLLVLLHGCGTTADQQMNASNVNPIAEREGFLIAYPQNSNPAGCWKAFFHDFPSILRGGGGEADLIADITRTVMRTYGADPERVYLIGMSSGGFAATATMTAYPDLFAAGGVMAAGGYSMDATCAAAPASLLVPIAAAQALNQMGPRARILPFIALGGTLDPLGEGLPGACAGGAFEQAMQVNNLVGGNRFTPDASATERGRVPSGYAWTREVWRDTTGCPVGERWRVEGLGHSWSGGSSDPQWATWTDPKGPSAGEAAWRFLSRYRKSDTSNRCVTASP